MNVLNIDAKTTNSWLSHDEAILIDVREPAEHSAIHIDDSKNIPLNKLQSSLPLDCHGKKLIFHCQSGVRSQQACKAFIKKYPDTTVYNLEGGIQSWETDGFSVRRSGSVFLPLDRQVQLSIGVFLIVLSIASYWISPLFILLTGLIGVGLSTAGLTGYCGLALLIANMPWNKKTGSNMPSCKAQ